MVTGGRDSEHWVADWMDGAGPHTVVSAVEAREKYFYFARKVGLLENKIKALDLKWERGYKEIVENNDRTEEARCDAIDGLEKDHLRMEVSCLKNMEQLHYAMFFAQFDYNMRDIEEDPSLNLQDKINHQTYTRRIFRRSLDKKGPMKSSRTNRIGEPLAPFLLRWSELKKQHMDKLKKEPRFHPRVIFTRRDTCCKQTAIKKQNIRDKQREKKEKNDRPIWAKNLVLQ
jgi:hypothetical protein